METKLHPQPEAKAGPLLLRNLLAVAAFASTPSFVTAQSDQAEQWLLLDEVAVVVNDEIITESELAKEANAIRSAKNVTISTRDELEAFEQEVVWQMVRDRLRAQAGRSLGIEDEQLQQIVDSHLDGRKRRMGLRGYIDDLSQRGLAAEEVQTDTKRQFLGQTWMDSVVGEDQSGQRPHRDRFIRPGYMHRWYVDNRESFGEPEVVEFERFVYAPDADLDPITSLAEAVEFRKRALAGEPLTALAQEIGPQKGGAFPLKAPVRELIPDSPLKKFADEGELGSISEIQTRTSAEGQQTLHEFFKLVDRIAPVAPQPFTDHRVQKVIDNVLLTERDNFFLALGIQDLEAAAYIEPPLPPSPPAQGRAGR
ncbi:MAG: hypothetical protein ACI8TQ_000980 [Planctomycetota bacterium]|jgi:hypothetical protein